MADNLTIRVSELGLRGADNYQLWLAAGNVGTLQDFLDAQEAAAAAQVALAEAAAASATASAASMISVANNAPLTKGPAEFLIGVWAQPEGNLATWAGRGVNTLVHPYADSVLEGGDTAESWDAEAEAQGFNLIRWPGRENTVLTEDELDEYLRADDLNPKVIAWKLPDEANILGNPDNPAAAWTVPQLSNLVNRYREVSRTMPIYLNQAGYQYIFGASPVSNNVAFQFENIHDINWFCTDIYPKYPPTVGTTPQFLYGQPVVTGVAEPYVTLLASMCLQRGIQQKHAHYPEEGFYTASRGKPHFSFVNCSTWEVATPAPSAAQFRAEVWSRIINGAAGIFYFPQRITPTFSYDATPADVLTEMATFHANIATLEGLKVLMNEPSKTGLYGRRAYTLRQCAYLTTASHALLDDNLDPMAGVTWASPVGNQLPGPFEGVEITVGAVTYRLVLNLAGVTKSLTDAAWGLTANSFGPYEVKCFASTAPTTNILAASGL